ncbi:DUF3226 domain-containing protein [Runella sp.]|jgi:hypothetical protein|uniref:DUF3226 domain-containing protein n=1 Tax=Runella sp. TaxID=1960881 RepID=UPI00261EC69F|nr:DUF3226 domain-containing protein [Runella sp.]
MSNLNPKNFKKFLVVEGNDDVHVIANIWKEYVGDQPSVFYIDDSKGFSNVYGKLEAYCLRKKPNVEAIGVVIDADADLDARWESIKYNLEKLGYDVPEAPAFGGTIIGSQERNPTIGIWLMPDNNAAGMLEDFVKYLVPENDILLIEADRILEEIEEGQLHKYNSIHKAKARIHTWLAWQEDPGTPMGLAITKSYLNTNTVLCQQFVSWLNQLFNS